MARKKKELKPLAPVATKPTGYSHSTFELMLPILDLAFINTEVTPLLLFCPQGLIAQSNSAWAHISFPLNITGPFVTPLKAFKQIFPYIGNNFTLSLLENNVLLIKNSQGGKFELVDYPQTLIVPQNMIENAGTVLSDDQGFPFEPIRAAMEKAYFSAAHSTIILNVVDTIFQCVFVNVVGGEILSSDSLRITSTGFPAQQGDMASFMLPTEYVPPLVGIKPDKYLIDGARLIVKGTMADFSFCADLPLLSGKFPFERIDELFTNTPLQEWHVVCPDELKKQLDDATTLLTEAALGKTIGLTIAPDAITIDGETSNYTFTRKVAATFNVKEPISFLVNPLFLREALEHANILTLSEDARYIFITNNDDFTHMLGTKTPTA